MIPVSRAARPFTGQLEDKRKCRDRKGVRDKWVMENGMVKKVCVDAVAAVSSIPVLHTRADDPPFSIDDHDPLWAYQVVAHHQLLYVSTFTPP